MKKTKKKPYEVVKCVMFRNVPLALFAHWKSICVKKNKTMTEEFIKFMKEEVKKDWSNKSRANELKEQIEREYEERRNNPDPQPEDSYSFLTEAEEEELARQAEDNIDPEIEEDDVIEEVCQEETE